MRKKISLMLCIFSVLVFAMMGCGNNPETSETVQQETTLEQSSEESSEESTEEVAQESEAEEETKTPTRKKREKINLNDYNFQTFELTSEDLHDGVWDTIITNTENGSNVSPQLTWEAVPEAECYVIYMVDPMGGDWLHWKSANVTETTLAQGWAPEGEYIGPYPPGGTHTYEIYVVALKKSPELVGGTFDSSNYNFLKNVVELDVLSDGTSGNLVAYGHLAGTYTYGD